jgi:hypothetical protein
MAIVLKDLSSGARAAVPVGTPFPVQYSVVRSPAGGGSAISGTILISCKDPGYTAEPNIPVTLVAGQDEEVDAVNVTLSGPAGAATVVVVGLLGERHVFLQDVT